MFDLIRGCGWDPNPPDGTKRYRYEWGEQGFEDFEYADVRDAELVGKTPLQVNDLVAQRNAEAVGRLAIRAGLVKA